MITDSLVSIIVPCFNASAYVLSAIESAVNQTWPDIEVIVVDDGSSDGSANLIEKNYGDRVRLFRQKNRGASAARNRGLREAKGAYIQYLDADDILHIEKIAMQMRVGKSQPEVVTWSYWQPFRKEPGDMRFQPESVWRDMTALEYFQFTLTDRCNLPHVCYLIPRAIAERAGPWDESLCLNDDGEYAARIVAASGGFVPAHDGPLYFYRKTAGSLSAINSQKKVYSGMRALDKISAIAESLGVDLEQTRLAWNYYDIMVSGYPYSAPYLRELEIRIKHYGGHCFKPHLGGATINRLAEILGWKTMRLLQYAAQQMREKYNSI